MKIINIELVVDKELLDLTFFDFYLWFHIKKKIQNENQLMQRISHAFEKL